jgi:probable rRNA maturation factor
MAYPSQSKVCFFFDQVQLTLENRQGLKKFIEKLFRKEGKQLQSLNYIFCSDEALLQINKNYLAHDYYTDIISFDLTEPGAGITGEIYISIDRVRDNAAIEGTTIKSELHRVIFHGALHLCGYGDKTKREVAEMRKMEELYLERYFR